MTKYYSPSTGGLYDSSVHKKRPKDAIKITASKYKALISGQESGQEIVVDNDQIKTKPIVMSENKKIDLARRQEYGSISDQLDMMYWDTVNGTTAWVDHIAAVKAKHPKG